MTANEIRELSDEELQSELENLRKEQFNTRFQRATDQLPQTHLITRVRRDIARVKTIMNERKHV